ncbi:VOC family protein, partial [Candidatus Microgenomates bacterium]|nr:VOC family protein [Candidatus Microgenomates bacterium]
MNKVIHFEIPADDINRAQRFYKEVFGWKMNIIPEMNYTIVQTGPTDEKGMTKESGFINGGMMKRRDEF